MSMWKGLIEEYRQYLPVSDKTPVVTLNEGNTPLIKADGISSILDGDVDVYLKYEGLNPTCSFKDRGMTMAVSKAVEDGAKAIMCASTGNTSAAAAAYACRAGIKCFVIIPDGNIALGKLAQALIHGATVIAIKGNFDDALDIVKDITSNYPVALVNSINPYRIQGQKTAAFEICDDLGFVPDCHVLPVGNAGNITAYWMGYKEYFEAGKTDKKPQMIGFQAAGSAPIVKGEPIKDPETIATAIRIGNPASWKTAVEAAEQSGGFIDMVTDEEILEGYQTLARKDGVFAEPASSATIAGLIKLSKQGFFKNGKKTVVCTLTGHGLKDPNCAIKCIQAPEPVESDKAKILEIMGL